MLLHLHTLYNGENRWARGGLGVGEPLALAIVNSERMIDLFFV